MLTTPPGRVVTTSAAVETLRKGPALLGRVHAQLRDALQALVQASVRRHLHPHLRRGCDLRVLRSVQEHPRCQGAHARGSTGRGSGGAADVMIEYGVANSFDGQQLFAWLGQCKGSMSQRIEREIS